MPLGECYSVWNTQGSTIYIAYTRRDGASICQELPYTGTPDQDTITICVKAGTGAGNGIYPWTGAGCTGGLASAVITGLATNCADASTCIEPTPTPTRTPSISITRTPSVSVTPSTSGSPASSCDSYTVVISSIDTGNAYGNSDPSQDGVVFVEYDLCNGGGNQTIPYSAGTYPDDFCADPNLGLSLTYYQNNGAYQANNSSVTSTGPCGGGGL
jgi:hypothetical protein